MPTGRPVDSIGLPPGEWTRRADGICIFIPTPDEVATKPTRALRPCGTLAAYRRHLKNRQVPCEPCAEASRIYTRRRRGHNAPLPLLPHGTHAAFARHYVSRTEPCDDCWTAEREYQREAKRRRRAELRAQKEAA